MATSIGFKLFAAVTAVSAILVAAQMAAAAPAPPPPGSYRQSCQDIRASFRILKARCATRRGGYVRTSLAGYLDCQGDIANADGRLVCREADLTLFEGPYFRGRSVSLFADAASLPRWFNDRASSIRVRRGTWQVCTDWNFRGRCQTIREDVRDLNYIRMNDRITSLRRVQPLPDGSYLQSCRDAEFDGRTLTADCRDRRGRF